MTSTGETILRLEGGLRFAATTSSGFEITLDSRIDGDSVSGPSPMEIQLVALGGCTGMDAISILRKMREGVGEYSLRLTSTRAQQHPKVYETIQIEHRLRGDQIRESNVRRAIALTMTRYCPVFAMLFPNVAITERYEITDAATGARTTGDALAADAASDST